MATLTKGKTFTNGETVTPQKLHELVDLGTVTGIVNADIAAGAAIDKTKISGTAVTVADTGTVTSAMIADGTIVNADINASAAIADTKLATIATAGKVSNSATTATNANTASAIVARDASGNFSAGTITATLSGNATNVTGTVAVANGGTGATTAATARTNLGLGNSATLNTGTTSGTVATGDHTHDDRYYTETEMNTLLAGKQASGSYAPSTGIAPSAISGTAVITTDARLSAARTPTSHTHDDRYYTEAEMNTLLAGKQAAGSYVTNGGSVSSIIRVTAMPATPAANTLYIVIP